MGEVVEEQNQANVEILELPELVDSVEAARILGLSYQWLVADRKKGPTIPYVKLGSGGRAPIRYKREELASYIEANTVRRAPALLDPDHEVIIEQAPPGVVPEGEGVPAVPEDDYPYDY